MTLVRESIHHGTYHSVRVVEVENLSPSAVARMVRDCPYHTLDTERAEDAIGAIQGQLTGDGVARWGWVDWEVITESKGAEQ